MSTYSKLWEQVSGIREALRSMRPDAKLDKLHSAKNEMAGEPRAVRLLERWTNLEEEMKYLDSHTGEPSSLCPKNGVIPMSADELQELHDYLEPLSRGSGGFAYNSDHKLARLLATIDGLHAKLRRVDARANLSASHADHLATSLKTILTMTKSPQSEEEMHSIKRADTVLAAYEKRTAS